MNAVLSEIVTVEKYEGTTCRISTRWSVLSGLQKLQSTGYTSAYGYFHIPCNLSKVTTINEIQDTASGKVTRKLFYLQLIRAKLEMTSQELQGILFLTKKSDQKFT